ncbi:DUF3343 domain-containing protein [Pseudoflavonifractor sp. AF19-9AC]|uniref:DUF3343 domain-containing protein n=1 Tax=Pseudoflavonifractor sp. AF19-9AC TaxID=2292244 RepID=UPI000E5557E3|nr:DUF3343 domain-containing protein [Pseudoflavonifractor sp. AF19-9AC]RHR08951.1 DUF3343 domain-containing protein [Pseudoflavonifractor sp. AF19-9AC]
MTYIATFYSHFGAIRFRKLCQEKGIPAEIMPVPRDLSSSCGSCVRYESTLPCPAPQYPEEVEQVVSVTSQGYQSLYRAENG